MNSAIIAARPGGDRTAPFIGVMRAQRQIRSDTRHFKKQRSQAIPHAAVDEQSVDQQNAGATAVVSVTHRPLRKLDLRQYLTPSGNRRNPW